MIKIYYSLRYEHCGKKFYRVVIKDALACILLHCKTRSEPLGMRAIARSRQQKEFMPYAEDIRWVAQEKYIKFKKQ